MDLTSSALVGQYCPHWECWSSPFEGCLLRRESEISLGLILTGKSGHYIDESATDGLLQLGLHVGFLFRGLLDIYMISTICWLGFHREMEMEVVSLYILTKTYFVHFSFLAPQTRLNTIACMLPTF